MTSLVTLNVFSLKCIIFYLLVLQLSLQALSNRGNETDYLALIQFKSNIVHDPQNLMSSWNESLHFCNWEGITCGRKHRRVSILDLQSKGLVGSLSPYVGNMSFLREISLQNNTFEGEVPPELGYLFRLQVLNLGNNSIEGKIPPDLSNCSNLLHLQLSCNKLAGNIPSQLSNLSKLIKFLVFFNSLNGPIPPSIGNLTSLDFLAATQNFLVGTLPDTLGQLKHLTLLEIGDNKLSGVNSFTGKVDVRFGGLRKLDELTLAENNLGTGEGDDLNFITSLVNSSHLRTLDFSRNRLKGVFPNLKANLSSSLQLLSVGHNQIYGGLPRWLFTLVGLTTMSIQVNQITGTIPMEIGNLEKLQVLYLDRNRLSGPIPSSIGNLSLLIQLQLEDNNFRTALPSGLYWHNMLFLNRARSNIIGSIPKQVFSTASMLVAIDLSLNNFEGTLPSEIGNLFNLNELYASENRLTGKIPNELGKCKSLEILSMEDVGNALDYLHRGCHDPIIHCDLKPGNILLDNDMVAHIGDFGLAKFLPQLMNPVQSSSLGVRGTIGYTAPEYGLGSELSTSGGVFSYGILLLEMMTGKKPTDGIFAEGLNLHNFARMALPDNVLQIVDPVLLQEDEGVREHEVECLIGMIKVGVSCSMESPQDRMDMSNAVKELLSVRNNYVRIRRTGPSMYTSK
ncbi:hypothetical protein JCGZ_05023 [Jatropha curcas]|uniref:non-specific serine/threonine protein kinase n=1 Tax=Jatropha curcas TaxID=180498 RepID=A0A067KRM5_JATCU|nr:hypothetical protein JCGZ_05023 [Jatropha curcas]